jgi:Rieske Fe-S protein
MRRREFMETAAGALAAMTLPGCAALVATPVTPVNGEIRLMVRNFAQLDQPGGWLRIRPAGSAGPLYVLALEGGGYAVLSPICTHLSCTVNIEGAQLMCPCHGSTFDRSGRVLRGPAQRDLLRLPARLTPEGELVIQYGGGQ